MNINISLAKKELQEKLKILIIKYNEKSDIYEILSYELNTLNLIQDNLNDHIRIKMIIKGSTLFSDWGDATRNNEPKLTLQIKYLYDNINTAQQGDAPERCAPGDL